MMSLLMRYIALLRTERRQRENSGNIGLAALLDPYELPAMRVIKHGDDRAHKTAISLSNNLFELTLVDFAMLLARRARSTVKTRETV